MRSSSAIPTASVNPFSSPARITLALLVLVSAACDEPAAPGLDRPRPDRSSSPGVVPLRASARAAEAHLDDLARRVPGFGGLSLDAEGRAVVHLRDRAQAEAARAAVRAWLRGVEPGAGRGPAGGEVVIRHADFGWAELAAWREALAGPAFESGGVVMLDADEGSNRLYVGAKSAAAAAEVERLAAGVGIPAAALRVEVVPPVRPGAGAAAATPLDALVRPLVGGLAIGRPDTDNGTSSRCTLGITAWMRQRKVFITASHCTEQRGYAGDTTLFWQPRPGVGVPAGREWLDDNGFSCGFLALKVCRHSDAVAVLAASPNDVAVGYVARTTYASFSPGVAGSTVVDPENPRFAIAREPMNLVGGVVVEKIGAATGWTRSDPFRGITRTCADVEGPLGMVYRCQGMARYHAEDGDSGAPVFAVRSDGHVDLYGIHWGMQDGQAVFSPIPGVEKDLDYLVAVDGSLFAPTLPPDTAPLPPDCTVDPALPC